MGLQVTMAGADILLDDILPTKNAQSDCKDNPGLQYPVSQNEYNQFQIPAYTFALVTSFSSVIFLVGVIGNLIVMFIVLRNRDMRNATNMCLLSLSAADMLVLCVCMPSALVEFYGKDVWYLGKILCKIIPFVENTAVNASAITILAISVERYYAICRPLRVRIVWTYEGTAKVIAVLWSIAATFTVPFVIMSTYSDATFYDGSQVKVCSIQVKKTWHKVYVIMTVCCFFILPCCVLLCIYCLISRRILRQTKQNKNSTNPRTALSMKLRKQVVLMLIIVTAIFFFCLTPFKIVSLWVVFVPVKKLDDFGLENYLNLLWFARMMYYLNSSTNPIVYNLVSTRFRNYFRRAVPCRMLSGGGNVTAMWTQTTPINGQSRKFKQRQSGSSSFYESKGSKESHGSKHSVSSRDSKDISLVVIKQKDMVLCITEKQSERKVKVSIRDSVKKPRGSNSGEYSE